jgi:hypothetical protein
VADGAASIFEEVPLVAESTISGKRGRPSGLPLPLFLGAVLLMSPAPLEAQDSLWGSVELPYRSRYLFAGTSFGVRHVQQAQLAVGRGGLTVYGFAVYEFDQSSIIEADLSADYFFDVSSSIGVFVGGALYNFDLGPDGGWEGTQEVYGGVTSSVLLNPTLLVGHDFDLGDGTHATLGLLHSIPLGERGIGLDLGGSLEYNHHYYTDDSGFAYVDGSVELVVPLGAVTLSPIFIVQRRLDPVFEYAVPDAEVWGITASFDFD